MNWIKKNINNKNIIWNIIFLLFVNLLVKPFWIFGIDRTVQNQLGETVYGTYFAILNFSYLFQFLLDLGIQNYNVVKIAKGEKTIDNLLPQLLSIKLITAILFFVVSFIIALPLHYTHQKIFYWILINQILLSFIIYFRSNVSANQHFFKDSLLSVLDKLLMIFFVGMLLWFPIIKIPLSINSFVVAQTIAYTITLLVSIIVINQYRKEKILFIDIYQIKPILKQLLPYVFVFFLMSIYYRIDSVMLQQMQSDYDAGIYAQSYRLIDAFNNFAYLIAIILLPFFAKNINNKKTNHKVVLQLSLAMILFTAIVIFITRMYATNIVQLLYHNSDLVYSSNVLSILIINILPIGLLYIFGTYHTARENFKMMLPTLFIATLLNIVLNYIYIPNYGAVGASFATVITQFFVLVIYLWSYFKHKN
ncbi:MAG: oligosaccharide flippase family protein [Chitinophagales bacterium]|nr:oligosaccharide flippase family protein [Chitinophagales bacterium]